MLEHLTFTPYHSVVQQQNPLKRFFNKVLGRTPTKKEVVEEPSLSCDPAETMAHLKALLSEASSIILFRYGTCVFAEGSLTEEQAISLMREHGPFNPGDESGDFHVADIEVPIAGTIVRYNHPALLSFVPAEAGVEELSGYIAGIIARGQRELDGHFPEVVGVSAS